MVGFVITELFRGKLPGIIFIALIVFIICGGSPSVLAQESPYIVTYNHYLEEPGSLEVEYFSTFGTQRSGNDFHAFWAELVWRHRLVDDRVISGRSDDLSRQYGFYGIPS